jgi:hypothetical protein
VSVPEHDMHWPVQAVLQQTLLPEPTLTQYGAELPHSVLVPPEPGLPWLLHDPP